MSASSSRPRPKAKASPFAAATPRTARWRTWFRSLMPPQQGPSPPARGKAHSSPDALCAVPSTTGNAAAADHTKRVCRGSGEKLNGALPAGPAEKIEERQQKTAGRSYGSAVRSAGFPGRKELSGNDNPRSIWTVLPLHRITAHLPGGECTRPLSGRLGRPDIMTVAPGGPPRRRCTARVHDLSHLDSAAFSCLFFSRASEPTAGVEPRSRSNTRRVKRRTGTTPGHDVPARPVPAKHHWNKEVGQAGRYDVN